MKFLRIVLYVLAAILFLVALVMLFEVFTARQTVESVLFPYLFLLGGTGPLVENLIQAVVGGLRTLFLVLFGICLLGSVLMYGMARLLGRVERQAQRIKELEGELARAGAPPASGVQVLPETSSLAPVEVAGEEEIHARPTGEVPGEVEASPEPEPEATGGDEVSLPRVDSATSEPLSALPPVEGAPEEPENSPES